MRRLLGALAAVAWAATAAAHETPYFVTYDHHLAEAGEMEVGLRSLVVPSSRQGGNRFIASSIEMEYGARDWWTTELYLDGQGTARDSTLFTGVRWENRFRPLRGTHRVNPVLYVELEDLSGADKGMHGIVGFDDASGHATPNAVAGTEREREVETKLILSTDARRWNFSENVVATKNLAGEPWEIGYALAASRGLGRTAAAGLELYGGLGTAGRLTTRGTSHYLAPCLAWSLPKGCTLRMSPGWGLTSASQPSVMRFGIAFEIPRLGKRGSAAHDDEEDER